MDPRLCHGPVRHKPDKIRLHRPLRYAGSGDYFPKSAYIVIALSPLVLWGILLFILLLLVPEDWFWIVYGLQIANIGGAAGDLYVVWRFRNLPGDILIQDDGVSMTVFAKSENLP